MRGKASTWWLCLHLVEERPSTSTRPCVSERQASGEVGLGQQEADDGRGVAEASGPYKRLGERGAAMKIRAVTVNNRRKVFAVRTSKGELHRSEEHTSELQSRLHLVCRL